MIEVKAMGDIFSVVGVRIVESRDQCSSGLRIVDYFLKCYYRNERNKREAADILIANFVGEITFVFFAFISSAALSRKRHMLHLIC